MSEPLTVEQDDGVRTLTLARPDVHNALNRPMLEALVRELEAATGADSAVILRGAGEAFSAGIDLEAAAVDAHDGSPTLPMGLQAASRVLWAFDGVSIAALDGHVVGAGLELACCCDLRIASPAATFRLPEFDLGVTLTNGATKTLPALVGKGQAVRMVLDGGPFEASEMHEAGLVDELTPEPLDRATELAERATAAPRDVLVRTLSAFDAELAMEATLDRELVDVLETQANGEFGR